MQCACGVFGQKVQGMVVWVVIIMMRGRMKPLEQEICGWGEQRHGINPVKLLPPSPNKRAGVLPPVSLLRSPISNTHRNNNSPSNRALPSTSTRLKTAALEAQTIETEHPLRLFPSLPMLSSADHMAPYPRERNVLDIIDKSFRKYQQIQEVFHSKLLQSRPKPKMPDEQSLHKTQNNNPETFRKRQSKETLKLSTIQIDSNELKKSLKRGHPKIIKKQPNQMIPLARSKMTSYVDFQGGSEVFQNTNLKKSHSKALPPLKYQGQFSDQTIFPKKAVTDAGEHLPRPSLINQLILVKPK